MPALFVFLFKVNVALVLFCLGYYLVLRHLTFYTLNRFYLVIAILFSTLYPQINLSDFAQHHQQLTEPVQNVILNWKAPAENFVKPLYQPNYWMWVEVIFWTGVALFAARLAMQLFSLYKLNRNSRPGNIQDHPVRLMRDDVGPFSFWRSIYINPASLSPADLKSVLEHEQVHVNEWHTVDILLAELSTIFYWFNPGVWLMKKAVRENIEFITDRKILQEGMDCKQYQYSLVSVSLTTTPNTIVNHFNISTIKKRIIMMNTKRSAGYNLTRYVFLVPAVVVLLLVFSLSKAAISKTSLHSLKSMVSAISKVAIVNNINNTNPYSASVKEISVKHRSQKPAIKAADTIYAGKSKDNNKSFMMTSDQKADSINYVLNGERSTKNDVRALDAGRILSLELVPAKDAKNFFPELGNDRQVLFVTTEDSEAGKSLKGKMDKAFFGKIAGRKNIAISGGGSYSSDNAPVAAGSGVSVSTITSTESSDEAPVTTGSSILASSVVVTGEPRVSTKTTISSNHHVYVTGSPRTAYTLRQTDANAPYAVNLDSLEREKVFVKGYPITKSWGVRVEPSISMSDKLIIIDGKQATEKDMKKLPVSDIKSLTEKTDKATREKYGDKAKNGVLFITTKKNG